MRLLVPGLCAMLTAAVLPAQSSPTLVGTWRLVSVVRPDSTGRLVPTWDEHPDGRIMYTADGHMAAQLYDTRRAKLGADANAADPIAVRRAFAGLTTYFGRYTVDTVAHTVSHRVEGAAMPDWIGGTLVRAYRSRLERPALFFN